MEAKKEQYKFSVVIPVYNAKGFLAETVDSVLNQDIGFNENIQIILVNDGSTDGSEELCLAYQRQFPSNIIAVSQKNSGVSAARNLGMNYVKGKYVNFLDSDDKWSPNAFSSVYAFFESHENEVDLVSCKQEFFEAQTGLHPLSRDKFETSRVIDILDEYAMVQLHVSASFVKASVMSQYEFDPGMRYGEDALYVNEVILQKQKYGVVSEPTHFYRKRANQSSAIQGREREYEWYFKTPHKFYGRLMEQSMEKWGVVIPYIQYLTCYDMQWRLNDRIGEFMSEEDQKRYLAIVKELLAKCEDDIILMQKSISGKKKLYLLSIKYGEDTRKKLYRLDGKTYWNNIPVNLPSEEEPEETKDQTTEPEDEPYRYAFSVVVQTTGEGKLDATMQSLREQTLSFSEQIQVILCTKRKNIFAYAKYLAKNVSVCRSLNEKKLKGRAVVCAREGQVWSKNTFAEAEKMFQTYPGKLSLLLEEAKAKEPQNHVVDLKEHAAVFQEDIGKYFFRRDLDDLRGRLLLTEDKWERLDLLTQILMRQERIGILENCSVSGKKVRFPHTKETYLEKLPHLWEKRKEQIAAYGETYRNNLDMIFMYQLAETMKEDCTKVLSEEELNRYCSWVKEVLMQLDDYLIYKGNMNGAARVGAFSLKYDCNVQEHFVLRSGRLMFRNMAFYNLKQSKIITIAVETETEHGKVLTLHVSVPLPREKMDFVCCNGTNEYPLVYQKDTDHVTKSLGEVVIQEREYTCQIPKEEKAETLHVLGRYEQLYPVWLECS